MSRAVRLEAVLYAQQHYGVMYGDHIGRCFTCGMMVDITKKGGGQAGHWRPRSKGGGSGTYFDERNVKLQCAKCNAWEQGMPDEFEAGLLKLYGKKVVDELRLLHKLPSPYKATDYIGLALHWKHITYNLLKQTGVRKWWKKD